MAGMRIGGHGVPCVRVSCRAVAGVVFRLGHGVAGMRIGGHGVPRVRVSCQAVAGVIFRLGHGMPRMRVRRAVAGMILRLGHGMTGMRISSLGLAAMTTVCSMRIGRLGLGHVVPGMWIHCRLCFSGVPGVARMRVLREGAATGGQGDEHQ